MRKSFVFLLMVVLIAASLMTPVQHANAQGITLPAEINKSFSPISIVAGQTSVLSVTIFNPNVFDLTNTSWTDNLIGIQPGLQIANPANVTNTCGGTVTAASGSTTLSLSGGTVPAQSGSTAGSCTVKVNVTSLTTGSLINTILSGALSATGGGANISNTSPASATLNVTGIPDPTITKSFSPSTIWAGATSRLTIVIRNNLTSTHLTQASLTDNLPANVFLANPVNPILTGCGNTASVTGAPGATSLTLNNGDIAPSSTCSITVSVTSNVQGAYTNTIPINSLKTQEGLTNKTQATAPLNVREIGLTKGFVPSTFAPGQTSILTITLQNPMNFDYTGVHVTDNLPSPLIVAGTANTTCGTPPTTTVTTTTNSVTLTGGVIPAGSPTALGTCTITVTVTVPAGTPSGTFTNRILPSDVTTAQGTTILQQSTASGTVLGSDLLASKSFSPSSITAGGNSRLRITITAPLDTNLTNFSVTDNLPSGVTISNSTAASASANCGATPPLVLNAPTGGNQVSLSGGSVLAGQQCRIDVYVTGNLAGSYVNTIPPGNITNDQNRHPANNISSTLNVTQGSTAKIELVKGFDPLIVTGGASSTMSVELINPGTATLTGIAFTDTMPAEMILANPVNFNVGTCGGTLTGTPGSNSFSFSGGTLPPLGRCTLTLSATMTVNGNLTNRIPAGAVTTANGVTNADPVQASLTNLPGASISKSFSPNPIPANSYSTLTITIKNTGNIELVKMGMTDLLPAGLKIAASSTPAPVNNCGGTLSAVAGTQLIQLTGGVLVGNASCTILVSITGSTAGDYKNTIPVGNLRANPNTQNNEPATATLTITGSGGGGGTNNKPKSKSVASLLIPVTGFQAGVVTDLRNVPHEKYLATGDVTLEIPSLGVKIPIVGVPQSDGTWNVAWLGDQAGWLEGSAFPSWSGNSVLAAHVYSASGLPGPFINLSKLKFGDKVIVHAYGQKYTFEVQTNAVVLPNDASVMKHEDKPWVTLVTCKDYDQKTGTYLYRVVVRAVLTRVDWE